MDKVDNNRRGINLLVEVFALTVVTIVSFLSMMLFKARAAHLSGSLCYISRGTPSNTFLAEINIPLGTAKITSTKETIQVFIPTENGFVIPSIKSWKGATYKEGDKPKEIQTRPITKSEMLWTDTKSYWGFPLPMYRVPEDALVAQFIRDAPMLDKDGRLTGYITGIPFAVRVPKPVSDKGWIDTSSWEDIDPATGEPFYFDKFAEVRDNNGGTNQVKVAQFLENYQVNGYSEVTSMKPKWIQVGELRMIDKLVPTFGIIIGMLLFTHSSFAPIMAWNPYVPIMFLFAIVFTVPYLSGRMQNRLQGTGVKR